MPGTSLYKTMLFSISGNICLSYPLWKSLFLWFRFFWFGKPYLEGGINGTFSDFAVQKLMLHSHGRIMIWDNDDLGFQVTQGIKSKKHDCKKGDTENSEICSFLETPVIIADLHNVSLVSYSNGCQPWGNKTENRFSSWDNWLLYTSHLSIFLLDQIMALWNCSCRCWRKLHSI